MRHQLEFATHHHHVTATKTVDSLQRSETHSSFDPFVPRLREFVGKNRDPLCDLSSVATLETVKGLKNKVIEIQSLLFVPMMHNMQ